MQKSFISIIGERIRTRRLQAGLTQEQLSEKAGLHNTYIGQVERGEKNISVKCLKQILDALNVSFSDFFIGIEVSPRNNDEQDIPLSCYELLSTYSKTEQLLMYRIISYIDKLSRRS